MSASGTSMRRLGKNTTIYTMSILVTRSASFLLLPLYTRYLTPADYGVLQLLEMTVDIAAILLTAGMTSGMAVFYFKAASDDERDAVVSTTFLLDLYVSLAATALLVATSYWTWQFVLLGSGTPRMVQLAGLNFTLNMLSGIPMALMRFRQEPRLVVAASLSRFALQVSFNIAFIVGLGLGPMGILLSTFLANLIVGGTLSAWLLRNVGRRFVRSIGASLVRFGLPYQITFAGSFIVTFGDRYFLQASHGVAVVGLYALAYQFGFLLSQVASEPFLQAWSPQMYLLAKRPRDERDARFDHALFLFSVVLLTGAVGLALGTPALLRVMTTPAFFDAAGVVPIILLAYVLQSLMAMVKFGIDYAERPKYFTWATWTSVAVTVCGYFVLIPRWGGYGAAWATVIGFAVRLGMSYYWSQRLFPVKYTWHRVLSVGACAAVVVVVARLVPVDSTVAAIVVAAAGLSIYLLGLWSLVLRSSERGGIMRALRTPRSALATLLASE